MDEVAQQIAHGQAELASLIARHATGLGTQPTAIPALFVFRAVEPSSRNKTFYEPSICLVAQGSKAAMLGDVAHRYGTHEFLLVAVSLPIGSQILEATPEHPHLGMHINLDPALVATLLAETPELAPGPAAPLGLSVGMLDPLVENAVLRLVRLLDTPAHIPTLAPLILREICYLLLAGPQGAQVRALAVANGPTYRMAGVIEQLRQRYAEPLRMDVLARDAGMSVSSLHHQFKAVTAMSPLQYQKHVRLQAARRLMLSEDVDAATASFRVGYESPSQFSREYRRMFGAPPRQDVAKLRAAS